VIIGEAHQGKDIVIVVFIALAFARDDAEVARLQWCQVPGQLSPKVAKLTAQPLASFTASIWPYLVTISSRSHRVTPARPWRFRGFGQAKVTLDLGQPAQDRLQALALATLVHAKPAHRRGQLSQFVDDLIAGLPPMVKLRQVAQQLLRGLTQQRVLAFRTPGPGTPTAMAVRIGHCGQP